MVDIYYRGYHTTIEGKYIFDAIKLHINKYRLTTNVNLLTTERISISEIEKLLITLYSSDSPYEIKQGLRYYRNTNKLVSEATQIIVIDLNTNNRSIHKSMSKCAETLNISRSTVKQYLGTGKSYKGYIFIFG